MMNNKMILIVDDQRELFDILSDFLNREAYTLCYRKAEEVVDFILKNSRIDLIIMDIMMPEINGYDLTKQIRELDIDYYIPIVMLTAKNEVSDAVRGLEIGADDYVKKPFEFSELLARINTSIRRSTMQNNLALAEENLQKNKIVRVEKAEKLKKQIDYLNNLIEISYELHSVLELDKLVNITLFALISHLGAKSATLMMATSPIESKIVPLGSKGILESELSKVVFDRFDPLYQYFLDNDTPQTVEKLKECGAVNDSLETIEKYGVHLIAPIHQGPHLDGFILLGKRLKDQDYLEDEIRVLKTFNSMLVVAICNASMYGRIKELSYTDEMTRLHNYRYFEKRLSEELSRARRNNYGLSMLILDVDHFKNYNDTLGHQAGDEALRILGRILKKTARDVDIVCRYGGEEFAIISPNVNVEGAKIFAKRITKAVEKEKFPNEKIQPKGRLTASVGISFFPDHTDDVSDLIYKADLALYKAKSSGRNQMVFYDDSLIEISQ